MRYRDLVAKLALRLLNASTPGAVARAAAQIGGDSVEQIESSLPHRNRALRLNRRLASRMLDAQEAWLDEVEAEFGAA